jgi:uncharacterized membrane protein YfbV (UPF0208 family)
MTQYKGLICLLAYRIKSKLQPTFKNQERMKATNFNNQVLKDLIITYLSLQIACLSDRSCHVAVMTDHIRASIRNKLTKATCKDDIQLIVESLANDFINSKLDCDQAFNKAIDQIITE